MFVFSRRNIIEKLKCLKKITRNTLPIICLINSFRGGCTRALYSNSCFFFGGGHRVKNRSGLTQDVKGFPIGVTAFALPRSPVRFRGRRIVAGSPARGRIPVGVRYRRRRKISVGQGFAAGSGGGGWPGRKHAESVAFFFGTRRTGGRERDRCPEGGEKCKLQKGRQTPPTLNAISPQ